MNISKKPLVILMAEDDKDDRLLAQEAMLESRVVLVELMRVLGRYWVEFVELP